MTRHDPTDSGLLSDAEQAALEREDDREITLADEMATGRDHCRSCGRRAPWHHPDCTEDA